MAKKQKSNNVEFIEDGKFYQCYPNIKESTGRSECFCSYWENPTDEYMQDLLSRPVGRAKSHCCLNRWDWTALSEYGEVRKNGEHHGNMFNFDFDCFSTIGGFSLGKIIKRYEKCYPATNDYNNFNDEALLVSIRLAEVYTEKQYLASDFNITRTHDGVEYDVIPVIHRKIYVVSRDYGGWGICVNGCVDKNKSTRLYGPEAYCGYRIFKNLDEAVSFLSSENKGWIPYDITKEC